MELNGRLYFEGQQLSPLTRRRQSRFRILPAAEVKKCHPARKALVHLEGKGVRSIFFEYARRIGRKKRVLLLSPENCVYIGCELRQPIPIFTYKKGGKGLKKGDLVMRR